MSPGPNTEEHCKSICDIGFQNNRYLSANVADVFNSSYIDDEQTAADRRQSWVKKGYEKEPTYDLQLGWVCNTDKTAETEDKHGKDNKEDNDDNHKDDDDKKKDGKDKDNKKRQKDKDIGPAHNTRSQNSPIRKL